MPKVSKGRLDGVWGMRTFTADELDEWAAEYEARITDPSNRDDLKWLGRRADRLRTLAAKKRRMKEPKERER